MSTLDSILIAVGVLTTCIAIWDNAKNKNVSNLRRQGRVVVALLGTALATYVVVTNLITS